MFKKVAKKQKQSINIDYGNDSPKNNQELTIHLTAANDLNKEDDQEMEESVIKQSVFRNKKRKLEQGALLSST